MASQAVFFAETISGMKKAIKRKAEDSDSEDYIEHFTNRGNKLRKGARYVHEGQLAQPDGSEAYKKAIVHAGFQREIISQKAKLYDDEGFEIDSDDDDDRAQAAITSATEFDPYTGVCIEDLLAPLTAPSDLPNHPTLSQPYYSKTLTELTKHACKMVHKERASLWRMKRLLTRLSGDHTWIPCGDLETTNDIELFLDGRNEFHEHRREKRERHVAEEANAVEAAKLLEASNTTATHPSRTHDLENENNLDNASADDDIAMIDAGSGRVDTIRLEDKGYSLTTVKQDLDSGPTAAPKEHTTTDRDGAAKMDLGETGDIPEVTVQRPSEAVDEAGRILKDPPGVKDVDGEIDDENDATIEFEDDQHDQPVPRRMRTRAQAQADSDNTQSRNRSMTPESSNESYVHPYFLAPMTSYPDRDFGLPQHEADETRRLLQSYIQKQEEVCRGAQKVYDGLLRAERLRHTVMRWATADGHVGEMENDEDWYDKNEWGLDEDLKKGQDEEEEDAATTAKKTRTRRQ